MAPTDLWDMTNLPIPERTPTSILKEQATALEEATKGILMGNVRTTFKNTTFTITLSVVAPGLNNYTFDIVHVLHDLGLYPLKMTAAWKANEYPWTSCQDEDGFITELTTILRSDTVRNAIGTLLAQSRVS